MSKPNVLFIMTDQQRFDTIAALGNSQIYTPNLDRLVERGISFRNAYTTCPVCVPARYTIRTGCEPPTTRIFANGMPQPLPGQAETMEGRCGPYLARTMSSLGYRTFGIGKSHSRPWDEDLGYDVHLHSEELYYNVDQRERDSYFAWLTREHPEYSHIEQPHGERTEMYYMPQMSPLPADCTVEGWAAARAVEQVSAEDERPYFGFVSFIGPHPPLAPPVPFNRMYDPDRMPNPVRGKLQVDHMDELIPDQIEHIWADHITDAHARVLRARYYGEISYIDHCLGKILDAVEARDDAENTVICFFSDHGDQFGDHHAWQKAAFFEQSCHVPLLVSWPARLPRDVIRDELACLADLFGIATRAAGAMDTREGTDVIGMLDGAVEPRRHIVGMYALPGTLHFKVMIRDREWKYIFIANGGREQLFNLSDDPNELRECLNEFPEVARRLRELAIRSLNSPGAADALDGGKLKAFPYTRRRRGRIYQFDASRGIRGFPDKPGEVPGL